jgi:hypothetical protein
MAKKKTTAKKSTSKPKAKSGAKKTSTAKKSAPKKEETPVAPPVEEPQVDADVPVGPGNDPAEPVADAMPEDLNATETAEPEAEETAPEEPTAHPDPSPEPAENIKDPTPVPVEETTSHSEGPAPVLAGDQSWKDRVKEEAAELKIKMDNLRSALDNNRVPQTEVEILNRQWTVMREYYVILNTRLSR